MNQPLLPHPPLPQYRCDDNPNPHLHHQTYPSPVPSLLRARARKFNLDVANLLALDADTLLTFDAPSINDNPELTAQDDADVWTKMATLGKTGPPPPPPPPPPDAEVPKAP
ncbi:hypothetical protein ONZ45_g8931 [Pleurotus djamor]|nr:hypothetical protein ONZ45_g8931 [Pleurotus djamor]